MPLLSDKNDAFLQISSLDLSPEDFWGNIVKHAGVAKLADALDLGSSVERRVGSSPTFRTSAKEKTSDLSEVFLFKFDYARTG